MNLAKLYEVQAKLKDRIGYKGADKFEKMMLALLVEIGECANEWRGFKYWSKKQKPDYFEGYNPLLEEYVDGLHFVLEHGLDGGYDLDYPEDYLKHNVFVYKESDITKQFNKVFDAAVILLNDQCQDFYDELLFRYLGLGEMLGFTWEQIEKAYLQKNAENHARQENGY
jgi:dimeric dUTPase (all-alpha-NTP-PPase superfamily)